MSRRAAVGDADRPRTSPTCSCVGVALGVERSRLAETCRAAQSAPRPAVARSDAGPAVGGVLQQARTTPSWPPARAARPAEHAPGGHGATPASARRRAGAGAALARADGEQADALRCCAHRQRRLHGCELAGLPDRARVRGGRDVRAARTAARGQRLLPRPAVPPVDGRRAPPAHRRGAGATSGCRRRTPRRSDGRCASPTPTAATPRRSTSSRASRAWRRCRARASTAGGSRSTCAAASRSSAARRTSGCGRTPGVRLAPPRWAQQGGRKPEPWHWEYAPAGR
jgi:hypothetical protein